MEIIGDGEHEFELVYRDGSVKAKVMVTSVKNDEKPEDTKNNDITSSDSTEVAPTVNVGSSTTETGDNSNLLLWMMLFVVTTLAGVVVLTREKKFRK